MNILVTGGAGYIGSHTCKLLARSGHKPVVFDNLTRGHESAVQWGPLVRGDLADEELIFKTLKQFHIEAVIHFAAYAYVGESTQNPGLYYRNNTFGSLSLLSAMERANVKKLVFSSTCATYGVPNKIPLVESHPTNPINPYGHSKLMTETMIRDFYSAHDFQATILRYFNAAGADPEGEIGENHEPETHLIPLAIRSAITGSPLYVFGNDHDTPDRSCIRDYIHVNDLAEAHRLSLEQMMKQSNPEPLIYNLGNGKGHSVFEVIGSVERISGKTVNTVIQGRRAGDPPALVADASHSMKNLGWSPKYTDLDLMISHSYNWELKKRKTS